MAESTVAGQRDLLMPLADRIDLPEARQAGQRLQTVGVGGRPE